MDTETQQKVVDVLDGRIVRKDLTQLVQGNSVVPSYVLEYLLGQYCSTSDEDLIDRGVKKVRNIISEHYVHRDESELVKRQIREKSEHKVIDRVSAELNEKKDCYLASFANLGISGVEIQEAKVREHEKLLTGSVWCIADMSYEYTEDNERSPWVIKDIKPIQLARFDLDEYERLRSKFSLEEWTDLIIQSIGLNPDVLSRRSKWLHLVRLISFCERNYNFIELGPKGTGKSHIFSEFSPHGILISGGDVTKAKLFVNNNTGDIGLVGYWDVVGFDEFAGQNKRTQRDLVDIMKNYMANQSFSRGKQSMTAEASLAFIGNTDRSVPYMLKHSDLFESLPEHYYDSAFIDRLHFYLPGWEIDKLRDEMFTDGYGFIVDYLAEALRTLRTEDFSLQVKEHFEFDTSMTKRDREGVEKTVSGLMKILFPAGDCPEDTMNELLEFAMEGRARIKNQLLRIDETFERVDFQYTHKQTGETYKVTTLENKEHAHLLDTDETAETENDGEPNPATKTKAETKQQSWEQPENLEDGRHLVIQENQTGVSYRKLFADYLKGATQIELVDPYLRIYYQVQNLFEFCDMLIRILPDGEELSLNVVTSWDQNSPEDQQQNFQHLEMGLRGSPLVFDYEMTSDDIHARSIKTDTGWKISLDRGLDIFQKPSQNSFDLGRINQEARQCKPCEITYLRDENVGFLLDE